ncbi:hypothetical protein [Tabrizicola flagellatus]|uniref:hypothetical protein n=1 Tax=Tabrizicola flagellatus TaxID=2593021 RepID=UPI0011F1572B|nr:hypothetical protein [Tabrizicola flagellatus]
MKAARFIVAACLALAACGEPLPPANEGKTVTVEGFSRALGAGYQDSAAWRAARLACGGGAPFPVAFEKTGPRTGLHTFECR